ncbi:MAG: HDOD domain-containing protein [Pyrinomonadaceae bacterium]|nr:HDOD domain-containing protein [Pyrinomonadaceae bacterium]
MITQILPGDEFAPVALREKLDIETLVESKLPPAPGTLLRLVRLLADYSTPRSKLISEINGDPILAARILRLANSPIYAFEREIMLVDMALTAVGSQTIYDIVVLELASRSIDNSLSRTAAFRKLWNHSIAVAVLTKTISETMEMRGLEESFICGLLHDFGKFLLLNHDLENYQKLFDIEDEFEMLAAEDAAYGFTHAEVGSLVARRWNLPDEICYAILNHHSASHSEQPRFVDHIIEIADLLAITKGFGTRSVGKASLEFSESVMKLGMSLKHLETIWSTAEPKIKEMISYF